MFKVFVDYPSFQEEFEVARTNKPALMSRQYPAGSGRR